MTNIVITVFAVMGFIFACFLSWLIGALMTVEIAEEELKRELKKRRNKKW